MSKTFIPTEKIHELFLECSMKICTDTRKIEKGSIFFALKGENFDANQYAGKAIEEGCAYAVVDNESYVTSEKYLLVENVLTALQKLSNYHRRQFNIPIIAITGSNGKTTSKELIGAVLSKKYNCLITKGNLNNHIGVPLTLLSMRAEHEIAIIEMGANHQNEIQQLCEIAEPGYGIITNIGKAHLEGFGGFEGVKKGKGELFSYLKKNKGVIFINGDDQILHELALDNEKITYGITKLFDVVGKPCGETEFAELKWKTRYTASSLSSAPTIKSHLFGKFNYINILCAACIGNYFHVEENKINEALSEYEPVNNRSQLFDSGKNKLILDMYNANPSSMRAAIENFSHIKEENKMLILGDMFELGEESRKEHEIIIATAREKKLSECIFVGLQFSSFSSTSGFIHFNSVDEVSNYLKENPVQNKTILVKGSRGMKLEQLVSLL